MRTNEQGFTLIEILVVITIIAGLMMMVTLGIPAIQEASKKLSCQNNLKGLGELLTTKKAGKGVKLYSGAAYLLQVVNEINDEDLNVYICPGEDENPDDMRPDVGSEEFIEMYVSLDLKNLSDQVEDRLTSYAGPNWKDYPRIKAGRAARKSRLIGCDKCRGGAAPHDGIVILYDSGKTGFLDMDSLGLADEDKERGILTVGPESADELLKKMVFFSR